MIIKTANSIPSAIQCAIDIIGYWNEPYCWYRGLNCNNLDLLPGSYWRKSKGNSGDYDEDYDEQSALISFVQEGAAFAEMDGYSNWDSYCLAQHYGLPTRLLDWTENFMTAMYFAYTNYDSGKTPCVWILEPQLMNKAFFTGEKIITPDKCNKTLDGWLPDAYFDDDNFVNDGYDNNFPISIYAKKSNARILQQQGSFTVHGLCKDPLNIQLAKKAGGSGDMLARIDFEGIDYSSIKRT